MDTRSQLCERARAWASLRPDRELSELESALLDAHLARCAGCRTFAQDTESVAGALRAARLERPAQLALLLPHRRTSLRVFRSAAAALAVVGVAFAAAVTAPSGHLSAVKPVAMVASADSPDILRQLRRPGLVQHGRVAARNRHYAGESV